MTWTRPPARETPDTRTSLARPPSSSPSSTVDRVAPGVEGRRTPTRLQRAPAAAVLSQQTAARRRARGPPASGCLRERARSYAKPVSARRRGPSTPVQEPRTCSRNLVWSDVPVERHPAALASAGPRGLEARPRCAAGRDWWCRSPPGGRRAPVGPPHGPTGPATAWPDHIARSIRVTLSSWSGSLRPLDGGTGTNINVAVGSVPNARCERRRPPAGSPAPCTATRVCAVGRAPS